jgi:hypothetical protein
MSRTGSIIFDLIDQEKANGYIPDLHILLTLMTTKLKLGGDASIAVGPVGAGKYSQISRKGRDELWLYISRLPSRALVRVTSSANSMSLPMGRP